MKKILSILCFPFLLKSQQDKTLHVYAGVTIGIGVSQLLYNGFDKPFRTVPISIGAVCLAGWGKETWDNRKGGSGFNREDLKATLYGGLISTICNVTIIDLRIKKENKKFEYETRYQGLD